MNISFKKVRKKGSVGKNFGVFFLLDTFTATFLMKNLPKDGQSQDFFPKSGHFFLFSNKGRETSPPL